MEEILKIALIQSELHWENPEANLQMFTDKINSISDGVHLVILPEMFSTGFSMNPSRFSKGQGEKTLEWMKATAKKHDLAVTGSVIAKEGNKFYNRLYFVFPDGNFQVYDKRHTFTLAGEDQVYAAGKQKLVVEYLGWKICPLICYDLRFPVWIRNVEDYEVCIFVANWPERRQEAWDALLKARAIENMAYCIGVNRVGKDGNDVRYNGHSMVYDGLGSALLPHPEETEKIIYANLEKQHIHKIRNSFKFLQDRDSFTLV